jgi:predicted transcriptional regulator
MNEPQSMTDKQMAMDALDQLPETASFQEIKEELEIVAGLKRGLDASEAGQVKTSAEVKEMVGSWFTK